MMPLLSRKVSIAWLLVALILSAALLVLFKVAVLDAPPSNTVLITSAPAAALSNSTPTKAGQPADARTATIPVAANSPGTQVAATNTASPVATDTPAATPIPEEIEVYVTGAVSKPGVYPLPAGSRIADAVALAGGLLPEADTARVNLAQKVQDEEHILVPRVGETPVAVAVLPTRTPGRLTPTHAPAGTMPASRPTATKAETAPIGKVNLNTATAEQLETLPGIGPSLSQKIIAFRDSHGPFAAPEDIMLVPGIKEGVYSKIRDLITVGP